MVAMSTAVTTPCTQTMRSEYTRRHAVQDAASPRPFSVPHARWNITGRTDGQPERLEARATVGGGDRGTTPVRGATEDVARGIAAGPSGRTRDRV